MIKKDSNIIPVENVHIWSASLLDQKNNVSYFASILSQDEQERAKNFKFSRDQERFIVARGILRCLLSSYLGQSPQSIEIIYGLWGKPCLGGEKPLYFNVSHAEDYALYAFSRDYEVGVDLEYVDKSLDVEALALNIFSPTEQEYWQAVDPPKKISTFFKIWVCKEAFLKALGIGWLKDAKKLSEMPFAELIFLQQDWKNNTPKERNSSFYYFECISKYASALFVESAILQPIHFTYDVAQLHS